jgi:hypothetical protein
MNQNDSRRAVALLERANPVELADLVSQDELDTARAEIQRLIAGAGTDTVAHVTAGHARSDTRRATGTATRRRRSAARLATVALAAAAAVAIFALSSGAGPATQSAYAQTISKVLRALQAPTGSILHVDFTGTTSYPDGHRWTWAQDSWTELDSPWIQLTVDQGSPGTPAGTASTYSELYDPTTNTVFKPPVPQSPPAGQITPGHLTAAQITPGQLSHLTPAQRRELPQLIHAINHPWKAWMSQYIDQLKGNLRSGQARLDGNATIDGQRTIKITFPGSSEVDYVAASTYVPVKITQGAPTSRDGMTTYVFHTFEYLPAATNARVFNLGATHPTAKVDTSLANYRAAINKLYPNG